MSRSTTWPAGGLSQDAAGPADSASGAQPPHRRRWFVVVVVVLLITAGVAVASANGLFTGGRSDGGSSGNGSATSLATVQRQTLSTQQQLTGALGYAGSYTVPAQARGTVTWLPNVGQLISQGQVLYRVDDAPVVLLYGTTPAYRTLSAGAYASDVTGRDVAELNADLRALGYATKAQIPARSDEFSWQTAAAVKRLQKALGVTQDGRLDLGEVVFLPDQARVTTLSATLGAPVQPGQPLLSATSTTRQVSVALDASQQSQVRVSDRVTITLPGGATTPGVVSSVGTVATVPSDNGGGGGGLSSGPTVPVTIRLTHPSAEDSLDQALVEVSINDRTVRDVLAVKVTALLAVSGGGYAVEVVTGNGTHHLVPVTVGLFDDARGMVQVSGSGLAAGQHVVVPGNA